MKKKLLSLVLAGAMVASTSVSAFADTSANTKNIEVQPTTASEHEVKIQGNVESKTGEILPSTVTVTVPTSASFTVKSNGTVESATMRIENRGNSSISVIASSFVDANGAGGIELVKTPQGLVESDRSKVYLTLTGGDKNIVLTSETNDGNKAAGKMYNVQDTSNAITDDEKGLLKKLNGGEVLELNLGGQGTEYKQGTNKEEAVSDNFKLVLKFKQEK